MKKTLIVVTLILLVFLTGCKSNEKIKELKNEKIQSTNEIQQDEKNERPNFSRGIIQLKTKDDRMYDLDVEFARSDLERTYGLMFVEELAEDSGMWFVFENAEIRNFWMKDTLIPLDIIFVGQDNKIINIENAEPCQSEDCTIYSSKSPAKYVLELNLGYTDRNNITVGDQVYSLLEEEV